MLQVLQFIFYSFWTWAGTVVLVWTATVGPALALRGLIITWRQR